MVVTYMYDAQLKTDIYNKAKEFGPRVRLVSVITDAPIEPDSKYEKNLCIHCKKCLTLCPAKCYTEDGNNLYKMDKDKCTETSNLLHKKEKNIVENMVLNRYAI